jgi:tetratricopeptide (TPR) repeat protein
MPSTNKQRRQKQKAAAAAKTASVSLKDQGVAAINEKRPDDAITLFTKAIDTEKHSAEETAALYSNRSFAHAMKNDFFHALEDAKKCIELRPAWPKGFLRAGVALENMSKFTDAKNMYVGLSDVCLIIIVFLLSI